MADEDQVGAQEADDDDEQEVRRPMHLKRDDPRAAAIEGKPKFKQPNPDEVRPEPEAARGRRAAKRK